MWRIALLSAALLLVGAVPAAADPVGTPRASSTFTVTCGEETFQVVGTGSAGHVLENNSIAVLMAATGRVLVNGVQVEEINFSNPGVGLPTLSCSAFSQFEDAAGNTVRIEFTTAEIVVTPARP